MEELGSAAQHQISQIGDVINCLLQLAVARSANQGSVKINKFVTISMETEGKMGSPLTFRIEGLL